MSTDEYTAATAKPKLARKRRDWEKIGAVAGIVSALVAIIALYPTLSQALMGHDNKPLFDGPIAQVAVRQKQWDMRGFDPEEVNSLANQITYRYAGHYVDPKTGDRNVQNQMCSVILHANPPVSFPYGGESGFVYIQTATAKKSPGTILHNPTIDDIYRMRLDYEYVQPECWPVTTGMKFPYDFSDYR